MAAAAAMMPEMNSWMLLLMDRRRWIEALGMSSWTVGTIHSSFGAVMTDLEKAAASASHTRRRLPNHQETGNKKK